MIVKEKIMKNIDAIITVLTSVIGLFTLLYKLWIKNNRKREERYYNDVLKPIMVKIKTNKEIELLDSVKELIGEYNDDVPKYIYHLIDCKKEQELRKVLISDYMSLYPNEDNRVLSAMDIFMKIMNYILLIFAFVLLIIGVYSLGVCFPALFVYMINMFLEILKVTSIGIVNGRTYFTYFIIGIVSIGIGIWLLKTSTLFEDDRYTMRIKFIEKMINKKISRYEKQCDKSKY